MYLGNIYAVFFLLVHFFKIIMGPKDIQHNTATAASYCNHFVVFRGGIVIYPVKAPLFLLLLFRLQVCSWLKQQWKAHYFYETMQKDRSPRSFYSKGHYSATSSTISEQHEQGRAWVFCLGKFFTSTGPAATTTKQKISDLSSFNRLQIGTLPVCHLQQGKRESKQLLWLRGSWCVHSKSWLWKERCSSSSLCWSSWSKFSALV